MTGPSALVLATLDTKGPEAAYLAEAIRRAGVRPLVLDLSVFDPPTITADIPREEVARAAGADPKSLRTLARAEALDVMATGAALVARRLLDSGELQGVTGLGGSQGTVAGTRVMATLPFGLPKLMVSTMASGNTRPYVGTADIAMLFPVVDLSGLNRFCRSALDNAGHAIAGMVRGRQSTQPTQHAEEAALTMFGSTTACVTRVATRLREHGIEPVTFHANGVGGRALEEWLGSGEFSGVFDISTTELADELVGGHRSAGPERLEAAGRRGIPQVVAPGALDMVNFGPPHTVPPAFEGRLMHRHNAGTTLMRTTRSENTRLGDWMAEKLNRARGPVGLVLPLRGFSAYDIAEGPFFDPDADAAFASAVRSGLRPGIRVVEVDAHINTPAFADAALELYLDLRAGDA